MAAHYMYALHNRANPYTLIEMDPVQTLKKSLTMFFLGFPLIIVTFVAFIGISMTNVGMLWLAAGHTFLVPIIVFIIHFITYAFGLEGYASVPASDVGMIVPSIPPEGATINVTPSWWISHVAFFFSYIIANAANVYKMDPVLSSTNYQFKVHHRQTRAMMIMIVSMLFFATFVFLRWFVTNAETIPGIALGVGLFGFIGYVWCNIAANGIGRGGIAMEGTAASNADIFGVVNQMVATNDQSVTVCSKKPDPPVGTVATRSTTTSDVAVPTAPTTTAAAAPATTTR